MDSSPKIQAPARMKGLSSVMQPQRFSHYNWIPAEPYSERTDGHLEISSGFELVTKETRALPANAVVG